MAEAAEIIEDEGGAPDVEIDRIKDACRIVEALIFASPQPVEESEIAKRLPEGAELEAVMQELRSFYNGRGINLVRVARKWTFRTAADLGWLLSRETTQPKKLSRAALETLAIIAYHQPVTRSDIEEIRGVAISKGTLDVLIETGWARLRGRRRSPGRPVTYGTTEDFLLHFGLEQITDLPGLDELKGAGLFDGRLPQGFGIPTPNDSDELAEDEDPLDSDEVIALDFGVRDEPGDDARSEGEDSIEIERTAGPQDGLPDPDGTADQPDDRTKTGAGNATNDTEKTT